MSADPCATAATEFPPNRPDIHTLSECRGGGCQAVHIDSLGWPIDAESAAVGRLTRHKSGEWLCAHGRYYLCCDEPNCPYRNERVRNDQPATAASDDCPICGHCVASCCVDVAGVCDRNDLHPPWPEGDAK